MLVPREPFSLDTKFLEGYWNREPEWGPLGQLVFFRTYAETRADGTMEQFWQMCQRVIEGMYQIQKGHCRRHGLPWNDGKAQRSAQDAFTRMFAFKWLPPGRGMSKMGSAHMFALGGACLNNCGYVSTINIGNPNIPYAFAHPFVFLCDMSMLGVGIGMDTRGAGTVKIIKPHQDTAPFIVKDSREGWLAYIRELLQSYVDPDVLCPVNPDYSQVRPKGARIKGFGGTASGPEALVRLTTRIRTLLDAYKGKLVDSRGIVDIANSIGECVVAGGVRRCLPAGTLVHTSGGLIPIEDVKVGMQVMTSKGYSPVTDWVDQGAQFITQITTQMGIFECTEKHQIACITDTYGGYVFKRANELEPGDRMVFVQRPISGSAEQLPPFSYIAPKHSTTCKDITIPPLTTDVAWFFGELAGNGYVHLRSKAGQISIAIHADHIQARDRVIRVFQQFGVNVRVDGPKEDDNCFKVCVKSKQLATYLYQFKQPHVPLVVPEFILRGSPEIRAAYVAGLADADGCFSSRPLTVVASVYPTYLTEVQAVLASLGIPSRVRAHKDVTREAKGWKPIYNIHVVGEKAIDLFAAVVAPHSLKYVDNRTSTRSQNDYGFPTAMIKTEGISKYKNGESLWTPQSRQMTVSTLERLTGRVVDLIPVEVLAVDHDVYIEETYDISVEAHEFVAQGGYLVHNTAEVLFAEPTDDQFLRLKDWNNPETKAWPRWASNNSVFADENTDFTVPAQLTATNGEPGYAFLENARRYGRMIDPPDNKDHKAMGANPCYGENTLIAVADGRNAVPIKELVAEGRDVPVYCIDDEGNVQIRMARNPRMTQENVELVRVTFANGTHLDVTPTHEMLLADGTYRNAVDLVSGVCLPKLTVNRHVEVGPLDAPLSDLPTHIVGANGKVTRTCNVCNRRYHVPLDKRHLVHCSAVCSDFTMAKKAERRAGRSVFTLDDAHVQRVANVTRLAGAHTVYNLTVEDFYTVGIVTQDGGGPQLHGIFTNQCLEQTLHNYELCCLVETFPHKCDDYEDYQRTLKFAYLYAKTVTLVPTHCEETNAVMLRNRRIGCSQSGIQDNIEKIGLRKHLQWCDAGYKYLSKLDEIYSDWFCIPKSIKMSSTKPSGSISKLLGCREGIHHEISEYILQAIRINDDSVLLTPLREAGYRIEKAINEANTVIVYFPVHTLGQRPSHDITMWEQLELAALIQAYWADNQVSVSISFDKKTEGPHIKQALEMYAHRLKGVSFIPREDHGYVQAPKTVITKEQYDAYKVQLKHYSFAGLLTHEIEDRFCDGNVCALPSAVHRQDEEAAQ